MEKLVWDERFAMGVGVLDKAHAKLFHIVGKLLDASRDPASHQGTYKEVIKYLEAYSMTHFLEEEAYMRSVRYAGYARHKKIHDNFRDKTLVFYKKELELSGYSAAAVQRFVGILNRWLADHIMDEDQAIVGKTSVDSHHDFSTQVAIISRAVNRASQDIFLAEAKLVNSDYKGANTGKGYYCRQWYDIEGKIKLQLLLGAEESLILRGASHMQEARRVNMTREIVLAVFEQLFDSVGRVFRVEPGHRLSGDNLLDRDGFRSDFMKGYACRLLFGTKVGYITFCYRSKRVNGR